jgi:tetratricopeptide (TPR) repeat protein
LFAEEITPEALEGVHRETEGNPFFIEEVCKALVESGKVYYEDGRWQRPSIEELGIPQSVRVAIQSRVRVLRAETQEALRLAAVLGREFDFDTLTQASELDEGPLVDALEGAERAQLIGELSGEAGGTFGFTHGLIPATLIEGLSGLRRRRLHRRVAAVIEALYPDEDSRLAALAYHYSQAGVEDKALHYLTLAGDQARASYANQDAIRYYSQALEYVPEDAPQRLDLLAARAKVYGLVARWEAQRADLEAILALAGALEDNAHRCDALIALAECFHNTGDTGCREPAERAAEIARVMDDPLREGRALHFLGWHDRWTDRAARGRTKLEAALARLQEAGQPGETAACLSDLSLALNALDEHSAALEAAERAVALSRQAGDRRQEATSLRHVAIIHRRQGKFAAALPAVEESLALHREIGDRLEECHGLRTLGGTLGTLGKPAEAAAALHQMLEIGEEIGAAPVIVGGVLDIVWSVFSSQGEYEAGLAFLETWLTRARRAKEEYLATFFQVQKALLLNALRQLEPALELAQSALPDADRLLDYGLQMWLLRVVCACQAGLGRFRQARDSFQAGLERAEKAGETADAVVWLLVLAYVAYLEDDQAGLRAAMEEVQRRDISLPGGPTRAFAHDLAACLHLALGDVELALESSSKAMQAMATYGEWSGAERYYLTHARVLRALGRDAEADGYLQRAYERVMLVASKTQDDALRRGWLENVPDNREIVAEWEARQKRA